MRKISMLLIVAGFYLQSSGPVLGAITHYADPLVVGLYGEYVTFNYTTEGRGWNSGGPFTATLYHSDNTQDVWQTFCVEAGPGTAESIQIGSTYKVWSTDLHLVSYTGDYVTDAAKWLYYQSLHDPGLLVGYVPGSIVSDSYLQEAIWHGVLTPSNLPLNTPYGAAAITWYNAAAAATAGGKWADANLVRVLNPAGLYYHGYGPQAQSQLYEVDMLPVPEPAALLLLAAGAFCLRAYAWRQRMAL
jgi:hypothetical protein